MRQKNLDIIILFPSFNFLQFEAAKKYIFTKWNESSTPNISCFHNNKKTELVTQKSMEVFFRLIQQFALVLKLGYANQRY